MNFIHPVKARREQQIRTRIDNLSDTIAAELCDRFYDREAGPQIFDIDRIPRHVLPKDFLNRVYESVDQKLGSKLLEYITRDEEEATLQYMDNFEAAQAGLPEDVIALYGAAHVVAFTLRQPDLVS